MDDKFDCIVVGGGIAGLSAAMTLARAGNRFLLVERGEFCGAKNVSGGVLWGSDLHTLVPDYWNHDDAGFERFVNHRRLTFMDDTAAFSVDFKNADFDVPPFNGVIVLRARFDQWLAEQVQGVIDSGPHPEDSLLATDILVEELLVDGGRVVGIRTGEEKFYADCVILAEGVNNLLTRQVGLQRDYVPSDHFAVGVKEVIGLDRQVLESRFQLAGRSGLTNEFVGFASGGVEGGGFLYTNRDSVSVGLVLAMKDLGEKHRKPYDLLNQFKSHPAVRDMISGGEVLEYSAHVVSTGDMRSMPRQLFKPGLMVAGEAANLLLNSGKAIQGMDYAMRSGILAARNAVRCSETGDYSENAMAQYQSDLEDSYVMKDLKSFQSAVTLFHSPAMYDKMPRILCDFGRSFFGIRNEETPKAVDMLKSSVKKHSSLWEMAKIGFKASRSL
ncbi:MAG: FAD-dependent oxidoreductase [Bacteroidetes bacterium]|nr:FAD-dependent oxidoreductase [Bacteroidota bacterium]